MIKEQKFFYRTSLGFNYCRDELGKRCIIKTDDNAVFTKYSLVLGITNKKCKK